MISSGVSPNSSVGFMLQKDLLLRGGPSLRGLEARLSATERRDARCGMKRCRLLEFADLTPPGTAAAQRWRAPGVSDVVLLDEPIALDAQTKLVLQRLCRNLVGLTLHTLSEAVAMSDRILVMSDGPGRIVEDRCRSPHRDNPIARVATPRRRSSRTCFIRFISKTVSTRNRSIALRRMFRNRVVIVGRHCRIGLSIALARHIR